MSTNFLTRSRHKSIYYFRRRIPIDINHNFENDLLLKSLNTANKTLAVILARSLASPTDNLFGKIRAMNKKTNDNFLASYVLKVDLNDKNQLTNMSIDAEPHESNTYKWSQYATKWGGRELAWLENNRLIERGDKTYFHSMRHKSPN
jgi:hypothetical protein